MYKDEFTKSVCNAIQELQQCFACEGYTSCYFCGSNLSINKHESDCIIDKTEEYLNPTSVGAELTYEERE